MGQMESIERALFEDPLYVYVSLAFVELALVGMWHARRSRGWLASLAVPVVLAVAVFATEKLVVTDREQIHRAMAEIADHVEAGSFERVAEYLDEDLAGAYGDKDQAVQAGRTALKVYRIQSLRYLNLRVEVDGHQASVRVTTVIEFQGRAAGGRDVLRWQLGWVKRPEGWRILEVARPERGIDLQ